MTGARERRIYYELIVDSVTIEAERHTTYGIAAYETGRAEPLACVRDMTTDKARLCRLIRRCNDLGLDPIHLRDIAYDLLNS